MVNDDRSWSDLDYDMLFDRVAQLEADKEDITERLGKIEKLLENVRKLLPNPDDF